MHLPVHYHDGIDSPHGTSLLDHIRRMSAAPSREPTLRVGLLFVQLAAIVVLVRVFELENKSVYALLIGTVVAFVVSALLPARYRLPFFAAVSVASVPLLLGLVPGLAVLAIGGVLIGICHLPIAFRFRVGLILVTTAGLMTVRNATGLGGLPPVVAPVLASMFMFRLALYLHSVRHADASQGVAWSMAYFFMLPNICFPLFPVVDYTTFVRSHFDAERFRIYDRAVGFIVRGLSHLFVYRLLFYLVASDGLYVNNIGEAVVYMVSTFMLYVKVSGQFWIIIGVLGLFGFRLPRTNHLYFLSSGPTDFWRRTNIYWKDFMMKLVYYPGFFRLRRFGNRMAVAVATAIVFVVTWLLHGYQGFWLQGNGRLASRRDLAFFGIFGATMIVATLWQTRPGRRPARKTDTSWSLARGVSTVVTFAAISVLWSMWNATTLPTWLFMWTQVRFSTPTQWLAIFGAAVVAGGLAGFPWGAPTLEAPSTQAEPLSHSVRMAAVRLLAIGCMLVIALPSARALMPDPLERAVELIQMPEIQFGENAGYYERLTTLYSPAAIPWELPITTDSAWKQVIVPRNDFLLDNLIPSNVTTLFGKQFTTNRWGMRDREFDRAKPPGTYRIALLGPSDVMGWGVADSEVFKVRVEAKLDSVARSRGMRAEVLNFAIASSSLPQQVTILKENVVPFSPDLIVVVVHGSDLLLLEQSLKNVLRQHVPIPDSAVARLAARVGIGPGLDGDFPNLRLVEEDLDRTIFREVQAIGAGVGAKVALLALRLPDVSKPGNLPTTYRVANEVGLPILDCTGVWDGQPTRRLRLSRVDGHPNAAGHRLISDCVFDHLSASAKTLGVLPLLSGSR